MDLDFRLLGDLERVVILATEIGHRLSVGFSAAAGIVFGILPAAKAAHPVESLRYE